jgi:predicted metal-dependent TIM-barrel fold hydrolase
MKHGSKRRDVSHLTALAGVGTPRELGNTPCSVDQSRTTHALVQRGRAVWTNRGAELLLPCCIAAGFSPETIHKNYEKTLVQLSKLHKAERGE